VDDIVTRILSDTRLREVIEKAIEKQNKKTIKS